MSAVAMAAIQDAGFEILEHPLYSVNIARYYFYLLPKLKKYLKGQECEDDEAVVAAVQEFWVLTMRSFFLRKEFYAQKKDMPSALC
ncbi:hypothetical protein EVAR_92210_1 [Eumeta japonica]|uniref:Histone-lysine N-methyltransferase SETMAR n=1 Tax=Eumeta variegata TaxID=151549 RepID=A0A4C1TL29_EUMVA|nr:hypothetical protein EVAR_92210_1 [Eumeta japonica]